MLEGCAQQRWGWLDSVSQAGAWAAAQESQTRVFHSRTCHYQFSLKPCELDQSSALQQPAAPGFMAPSSPNALIASDRTTERASEAGTLTTHRDKEKGRSNLFSGDDISIIGISFFPHVTST